LFPPRIGDVFQAVEDFGGSSDAEDAFIFSSFIINDADGFWDQVIQVFFAANNGDSFP
jgi:hypothetical protein